jgi:hypothetical protein
MDGPSDRESSRLRERRCPEISQAAFALVFSERLHATCRKVGETAIQRGERLGVEWWPVRIGGVA